MDDCDYMFKLVLLGSSGVGKSNILLRFTKNEFNEKVGSTIGVEYATKTVQTQNKKRIKFQIWDTAGQQQYRALMKTFYKGASAALLTYDITDSKSFTDLQYWYKQIIKEQFCKSEIVVMLVGNKTDLDALRQVSKQDGLAFAEKNRVAFYEVSAKTGANIDLIFGKIAEELEKIMVESERPKEQEQGHQHKDNNKSEHHHASNKKSSLASSKQQQQSPVKITKQGQNKKTKKQGGCCGKSS